MLLLFLKGNVSIKTFKTEKSICGSSQNTFYTCSFKIPLFGVVLRECEFFHFASQTKQKSAGKKKKRKSEKRYPISPSRNQHLSPFSEPVIVQFGTTRNDILSYNRILITDTKVLQIYPNLLKFQMRRNHIQKSITVHVLFLQLKQKHCESRD